MTFVTTKNLTKYYGKKIVLRRVSMSISKGKIYGLLGPNGAGKTTIVGILSGFINKNSGDVKINSLKQEDHLQEIKNMIGLLPQDAALYGNMTVMQHMVYFAKLQGLSKTEALTQGTSLLKKVGLLKESKTIVRKLSHGMRRLLGFAQALIGNPKILLLDEPTSGLDPIAARNVRNLIKELRDENVTVVFCSHNLYEVEELCDLVGVLLKGKLLKEEKLSTFSKHASVTLSVENLDEKFVLSLKKKSFVKKVEVEDTSLIVEFKKGDHTNKLLKLFINHGLVIEKIKKGYSLEDVYRRLVAEG